MVQPIDGQTYDFNIFGYSLADTYDLDNGSNIGPDGTADYDDTEYNPPAPDDGRFNFGEDGNPDEPCTATGDWDFGFPWGQETMTHPGTYDFNKLSGSGDDWFVVGTFYELENTPLYANYTSEVAEKLVNGGYYVFDKTIANGKIRLCKYSELVGVPCGYSGWFATQDLINLGKPSINDYVSLTGTLYLYPNGYGGAAEKTDAKYYIVSTAPGEDYPYGLGDDILATPIGYADEDHLTILERNSSRRQAAKRKKSQ